MSVTDAPGGVNALLVEAAGGIGIAEFLAGAAGLVVGGDVVGVAREEFAEFGEGRGVVGDAQVFHAEHEADAAIGWVLGDKALHGFQSRHIYNATLSLMESRAVRESVSDLSEFALPIYANPLGNLLGGRIMHLVDLAAATAAMRHARGPVVTASVDQMTFLHPIRIGQLVTLRASVNRVFRTSMEVGVKVFVEDLQSGEVRHSNSSYLTFVALSSEGVPREVPPLLVESEVEQRRWRQAGDRRAQRLELRQRALEREALEG